MNHQVNGFLQRFIRLYLAVLNAFFMRFLRLIGFISFTAMVKQIGNVMANAAYIVSSFQRLADCGYGRLGSFEGGNASRDCERVNSTPSYFGSVGQVISP